MKQIIISALLLISFSCTALQQTAGTFPSSANNQQSQIAEGLKQALTIGTQNSTNKLSAVDGFFADAAIKILMPPEAQNVEKTLRQFGLGSLVDKTILSLNRAAEDAAKSATPIFVDAIRAMTLTDALNIVRGGDTSVTHYFREKTSTKLFNAFRPVIQNSLDKVDATKYYGDLIQRYNDFPTTINKLNPDLASYVTGRATDALFSLIAVEEKNIRENPVARTTEILRKVFGGL